MSIFKGTCHTCNKNCCDYDKLLRYFRERNMDSKQSNFKKKKFHRRTLNVDMSTGYTMDTDSPHSEPNHDDDYKDIESIESVSDLEMEIDNIEADSDFDFDINFDAITSEYVSLTDEFDINGENDYDHDIDAMDESLYRHVLITSPRDNNGVHINLMYPIDELSEIGNRLSDNSINDPIHDDSMDDVSLSYHEQDNNMNLNERIKEQVTDSFCKWMKPSQAESDHESEGSLQGMNDDMNMNGNRNRRNNNKSSVWRKLFWLFID